jgi:threonine dehydrogenase-like Zn-dependent dehydrogenase
MTIPAVPSTTDRWELCGAGLEQLVLERRPLPEPGPRELLLRVDACGICFSDIKILNLGGEHPRLTGRNLAADPVVMGHETAMTVARVGAALGDRFAPGQRFIIQADVYYRGVGMAFGYRLAGGYSQYQLVGEEVLAGDEGCYLLPIPSEMGYSQAALCEPWACVEAAYAWQPRRQPLPDGARLLVAAAAPPDLPPGPFDDILVSGRPTPALAQELLPRLRPGGVFGVSTADPGPCVVPVDVGRVHYQAHWLTAATNGGPPRAGQRGSGAAAYPWNRDCELWPGGSALFIGAGGPLGQMHLQRALSLPGPPGRIVATQRGGPRLAVLQERFGPLAARRGVAWTLLDARELGEAVYDRALAVTGGRGFDDVVTIAPDVEAVAQGYRLLAPGGGLNIFAGLPVGTRVPLDLARVYHDQVRLWGTSGSTIADLRRIADRVAAGDLDTDTVVAAVGGIRAVADGLAAVRDARFMGKTVIYPHLRDLPLLGLDDLAARHATVAERLTDGKWWNRAAEAELFRLYADG